MSEVTISGESFPVGQLDVKTVTACLAAAKHLMPMTKGEVFESLTENGMESTLDALQAVTGCPRTKLEALPLHEFIQVVGNVAHALFQENLEYLNGEVSRALVQVTEQLTAITDQSQSAGQSPSTSH